MGLSILKKMLKQKCVYWGKPISDGRGGVQVNAPVELNCRWEKVAEEYINSSGIMRVSQSIVYTESLDGGVGIGADLAEGGYLYEGLLIDLHGNLDPLEIDTAFRIEKVNVMPTLKANQFLRTAML